ncbi:MAG: hypothetical protein ACTHJ0_10925 [Flavipsychrobacter sp.]
MKHSIILTFLLLPFLATAQTYELGAGGGISLNGKPTNNLYFKGDKLTVNYASYLSLLKNMKDNVQMGIDIHMLELSRKSSVIYDFEGRNIGGDNKRFVYAKYAFSIDVVLNKKYYIGKNYVYGGIAAGLSIARNNAHNLPDNVSYGAPDGGYGLSVGAQLGYVYNIDNRWALNAEVDARYYDFDYKAIAPIVRPFTNIHYRIVAYPLTISVRYKFSYFKKPNATTGEPEIVK